MATIAIGDVHGHLAALEDLLGRLESDLGARDTVVFLGDYIDRGPDSRGCIDAILNFRARARASVVCLLGNHEDWLLRTMADHTRHSWLLGMEAFVTIASYSPAAARTLREAASAAGPELVLGRRELPYSAFFDAVPRRHMEFLEGLRPHHQTADGIFAHAGVDPRVARLEDQTKAALIWGAPGFPADYHGEATVVHGHWGNPAMGHDGWPRPRISGRTISIDTIAHGILTAVRLPDGRLFQSGRHAKLDC